MEVLSYRNGAKNAKDRRVNYNLLCVDSASFAPCGEKMSPNLITRLGLTFKLATNLIGEGIGVVTKQELREDY